LPQALTISAHPQSIAPVAAGQPVPAAERLQTDSYKEALGNLSIQRKLSIGAVDDPLEQEADAMADTVMRMPTQPFVQRKCSHCEEEESVQKKPLASSITPFIQTKGGDGGTASDTVTQQINSTRGSGSNMDRPTQSFMESRFGSDFSGVKIHTGDDAVQMSRELNAQAFTVGSDIYFNSGKYNPSSESGKHLLAHELTHTVQQGGTAMLKQIQRTVEEDAIAGMTDEAIAAEMNTINDWLNMHQDESVEGQDEAMRRLHLLQDEYHSRQSSVVPVASAPPARTTTPASENTFLSTITGALMGEFNEDPSLAEIALDTGVSLIPVVDQVADARDITAHLYFMIFRGEALSIMRWVGLVLSLIGLFPEVGTAIKGAGRVVILGATTALARLSDILEPFRRLLPGSLDYRRIFDYVLGRWDEFAVFTSEQYRLVLESLGSITNSFWMRLTPHADEIRRTIRLIQSSGPQMITDALDRIRRYFQELADAIANPHALTPGGMHASIPNSTPALPTVSHMSSTGSGGGGSVLAAARRIPGTRITDTVMLAYLRRTFGEIAEFRRGVTLPPARTASGNPTISRLDIAGEEVYGASISAASPSRTREEVRIMQELIEGVYGTAPFGVVMEHAEADAIISAFNRNLSAESAFMHVDRPLCGFCESSLRRILPLINMRELTIYQMVPETGEFWQHVITAVQ
jgi:hypothetical protein